MSREKRVLNSICHILVLFGIAFIILGVILSDSRQPLATLLDVNISPIFLVGVLSICIGAFTFLMTVLGLYGSIKERRLALFLFMIALVISAVIQVANIYFALIYSSSIRITIEDGLLLKMYLYSPNANRTETDFVRTWDFTQQKDGCCGVLSPADWGNVSYFADNTYPDSCCRNMTYECGLRSGETDIYSEGCLRAIVNDPYIALLLTAVASVALFLPELLGFLSANATMKSIQKKQKFRRIK